MSQTPIVYLDVDDEITSAAARIRSSDSDRLALVLPYGSRLATSRINFRLLAREAAERNKTIEIVAADSSVRALAASAGLTVHASVAAFEGGPDAATSAAAGAAAGPGAAAGAGAGVAAARAVAPIASEDDAPTSVILVPKPASLPVPIVGRIRPPIRAGVAVGAGLALVAVLAIGAVLAVTLLPSATIVVYPRATVVGPLAVNVEARPDVTAPDATALTIPAHRFTFPLSVTQTFATTGVKVTETKATGSVTFQNCDNGRSVRIPAGSTVSTSSGLGFRTQASLTVGMATRNGFLLTCKTGSVNVQAEVAGTAGNIAAGQINQIPPGYDPTNLAVTNQDPTSGGTHTETPQVSQTDIDTASAALTAVLTAAFDTAIQQPTGIPAGTTLFNETKVLGATTPTVNAATLVGQTVAQFQLGLSANGTVLGVDASPIQDLAAARLATHIDAGWALDQASVKINTGRPTVVGESVTFPVTMQATEIRSVNQADLLAAIRGLDLAAARAKLETYGDVDIKLWPDWVTTIPSPDRVTLTIGEPRPAASPTP
jgi:Baseplate J-like protein